MSRRVGWGLVVVLAGIAGWFGVDSLFDRNTPSSGSDDFSDWNAPDHNVAAEPASTVHVDPDENFGTIFSEALPGTTYVFEPGLHTGVEVQPRVGDEFVGMKGAVLDGGGRLRFAFHAHDVGQPTPGVVVRGLTIRNYDTPLQLGVVGGGGSVEWLVEGNEILNNAAAGVEVGSGMVVRGNLIHHNGQLGIHGGYPTSGVVIEDNEIAFNNHLDQHDMAWEAGGMKLTVTNGARITGNFVHDNHGPGLWTDGANYNTLYERNRVVDNFGPGIFHEISYDAVIRNNDLIGNAHRFYVGGILVANSSGVEVYGNRLDGNRGGVVGIQDDRGDGPRGPYQVRNLWVHDNEITHQAGFTGVQLNSGSRDVFSRWGNRFERNTYEFGVRDRPFEWNGRSLDREQWVGLGLDQDGVWR